MASTNGSPIHLPAPAPPMLYLRRFITHAFGLDDYLVLLALFMVLVFAALSTILTTYGIGYHQDTVPTSDMIMMEKPYCFHHAGFPYQMDPADGAGNHGAHGHCDSFGRTTFDLPMLASAGSVGLDYPKLEVLLKCRVGGPSAVSGDTDVTIRCEHHHSSNADYLETPNACSAPSIYHRLFFLGFVACGAGPARIPLLDFQVDSTDYTYVGAVPLILMNIEYALGLITGSLPSLRVLLRNIPGLNSNKKSTYPSQDRRNGLNHSGYHLSERSHWARKFRGKGKLDHESCNNESQQQIVVTTTVEQDYVLIINTITKLFN
ncbi:hypothetical protein ASPBRDRAFT_125132 [Aspergillus brasiliensis CBS 101740]|uniref:Rhodopsin domain-containing protein n=1 Tax=Aspergillus brasiliensis (strain CBS 101740 / IMI 381727 / IBT 21946) TaxID=767769 RepID=A0A1L9UIR0_ASPBC|nr:hypothetical protein ASPBRDRAFT_125132 [Aspergillus brasiliensis CBS 101740]